jgi:hypothetical protein
MCRAVDFDNQFGVNGDEVDDVSIDRMLAAKFIMGEPAPSQRLP